ncbi:ECF sigma factor [Aquisphaera giovannonii]|uniref:ECF sigma factor n=1 Tax=Aquisphaera giovannonii TaxID=406548 RepID=A0A5B9WAY1_9BACT|nr:ECF-type sigma factor [Aquisphaera giovannonii]QEH37404.1 ECF sigma factor [Aquisphaera giovannonii]
MPGDDHSVTLWLSDLKGGKTQDAVSRLWNRYFHRLARVAESRLRSTSAGNLVDGEDIAASALEAFCRGASEGRYAGVAGRDDLERLLYTITVRKALKQRRREHQLKRGGGRILASGGADSDGPLDELADQDPGPALTAAVEDEIRHLFASLADESLRIVALLRMEGFSNNQIARALDCSLRSVERKVETIRQAWEPQVR